MNIHKEVQNNLLYSLLESNLINSAINEWASKLWSFQEAYGKILYSELSTFIIETDDTKSVKYIKKNLEKIAAMMDRQYANKQIKFDQYQFWLKYKDHCELAMLQRRHYNISKNNIKEITRDIIKTEAAKIQKDLTGQLITLVSIFTALSFVIFGGISILGSLLDNIKTLPILRVLFVGILWMLCMTNLFMLFIKLISKITDKTVDLKGYCAIINSIFLAVLIFFVVLIFHTDLFGHLTQ